MAILLQRLREASGLLHGEIHRGNGWRRWRREMVLLRTTYGSGHLHLPRSCFLSRPLALCPHAHLQFSSQVPSLHLLDSFTTTQASQVSLYIDTLLDWNQVSFSLEISAVHSFLLPSFNEVHVYLHFPKCTCICTCPEKVAYAPRQDPYMLVMDSQRSFYIQITSKASDCLF